MNVLLLHPNSPFLMDARTFPPLGVLYLGAALKANGHTCSVVDMGLGSSIEGYSPDLIGISCTTAHIPELRPLIARCKSAYRGVPIILGGPHFSCLPDDGLKYGCPVVMGDGEEAITEITGTLHCGGKIEWYLMSADHVDVNRHPLPDRSLLPMLDYHYMIGGMRAATMMTSRGCPYACRYCSKWKHNQVVRYREIENIVQEVRDIKSWGLKAVMFFDDEFNLSTRRTAAICEALKPEGIKWRAFVRSNLFTREQARLMKDAGCHELCSGVESGSNEILIAMNKRATVEQGTETRRICAEFGIRFKAFMIVGLPGETEETVQMTKQWLLDVKPDDFDLALFQPYPGTPWADPHADYEKPMFHKGVPGNYTGDWAETRDRIDREVREELGMKVLC